MGLQQLPVKFLFVFKFYLYYLYTIKLQGMVNRPKPVIKPSWPELVDQDRSVRLQLQKLVHVSDRFILEICRHKN